MALNLIWTLLTQHTVALTRPVCRCSQLSRFIPTRTSQQDKHTIWRGTFQCSFLMGNKSVSTGVDDTRGTPQGAHPFCCGHQGQGSFHSLPLLLSDQGKAPTPEASSHTRRSCCTHPDAEAFYHAFQFSALYVLFNNKNGFQFKLLPTFMDARYWIFANIQYADISKTHSSRYRYIRTFWFFFIKNTVSPPLERPVTVIVTVYFFFKLT